MAHRQAYSLICGSHLLPSRAMVTCTFLLALPMLNSSVAFSAVTSIATIGLYISYVLPTLIKLLNPKDFVPGPFSERRFIF